MSNNMNVTTAEEPQSLHFDKVWEQNQNSKFITLRLFDKSMISILQCSLIHIKIGIFEVRTYTCVS